VAASSPVAYAGVATDTDMAIATNAIPTSFRNFFALIALLVSRRPFYQRVFSRTILGFASSESLDLATRGMILALSASLALPPNDSVDQNSTGYEQGNSPQ
jgi:hypothetical protein